MLKIITIGDPHFRTKYIKTIDQFTHQTLELIKATAPDFVVVLGDTLHHHERTDSACHVRAVKWFLAMSEVTKVVVLIGNHDRPNNSDFQSEYHFFTGLKDRKNMWIVDKAMGFDITIGGTKHRMVCVPYVPPGRFREALDTLEHSIEERPPFVIFSHQEYKGVKMGAIVSEVGDEWPIDGPFILNGHLHECQSPQDNIFCCGTPYQTTYAEDPNKGVYLCTFNLGVSYGASKSQPPLKPDIKRIKLNLKVKSSITVTPEGLKDVNVPGDNMDLRIIITGKQEDVEAVKQTQKYKDLKKVSNITLVLRPQFEFKPLTKMYQKSYKEVLHNEVKDDPQLAALYAEILSDLQ